MSVNIYVQSNDLISDMKAGRLPKGSIVEVQWPSGAREHVRYHYYNDTRQNIHKAEFMMGCNMGWDNRALDSYDLSKAVVSLVEKPKSSDERWK